VGVSVVSVRCLVGDEWVVVKGREGESYEWKSAVVAWRPWGRGMNSAPAPLITVIGLRFEEDTERTMG
jgi:hypothetical protein